MNRRPSEFINAETQLTQRGRESLFRKFVLRSPFNSHNHFFQNFCGISKVYFSTSRLHNIWTKSKLRIGITIPSVILLATAFIYQIQSNFVNIWYLKYLFKLPCFSKLNMKKRAKLLSWLCVSVKAYVRSWVIMSLTLLSDGIDSHNWPEFKAEGVGFDTCSNLKMTLYSQINPISPFKGDSNLLKLGEK